MEVDNTNRRHEITCDITHTIGGVAVNLVNYRDYAECGKPGVWPDSFTSPDAFSINYAMNICAECPVRVECLENALAKNETFGIWGGKTEQQRDKLTKQFTRNVY